MSSSVGVRRPLIERAMIIAKHAAAICGIVTQSNPSTHRLEQGLDTSQNYDCSGSHWLPMRTSAKKSLAR